MDIFNLYFSSIAYVYVGHQLTCISQFYVQCSMFSGNRRNIFPTREKANNKCAILFIVHPRDNMRCAYFSNITQPPTSLGNEHMETFTVNSYHFCNK